MKTVRIGIVGVGGIANNKHIAELSRIPNVKIAAICDIDPSALEKTRARLNLPSAHCYSDYHELIADPEVDAVEVCTPNVVHAEIAKAVLQAGKPLNLEKPIAMNEAEARDILQAQKESATLAMVCFSYRFMSAVRYAKRLVDDGAIGKIVGLNVNYLKCSAYWEGRRLDWRFDRRLAGSGVASDLGSHLIDMAELLAGRITEIAATTTTAVKERLTLDGSHREKVTTDDSCLFLARFSSGAEGTFHITRCAIGHANTIRYDIYGDRGSLSFDLNNPDRLTITRGDGDPRNLYPETVDVPNEYKLMQEQAFINAILGELDPLFPTLEDGVNGQRVIDAILESSDTHTWVAI